MSASAQLLEVLDLASEATDAGELEHEGTIQAENDLYALYALLIGSIDDDRTLANWLAGADPIERVAAVTARLLNHLLEGQPR